MLELIGQGFMHFNLLNLGVFPAIFALTIGISNLISKGNMETFMISIAILNYGMALFLFYNTDNGIYFLFATIVIFIMLLFPDGTRDILLARKDEQ